MKTVPKILSIFALALLLIVLAGVIYIVVSSRKRQNALASEAHMSQEEELQNSGRDEHSSQEHLAYFYAVEFLVAHDAENEGTPGFLPLPDGAVEMPMRSLDNFFLEQGKRQLEELFNDSGFIAYLQTLDLILSREPYENVNFVFYDFLTLDGRRIGSIGIQKRLGEVYLFDDEYISLGAIQTFGLRMEVPAGETIDLGSLSAGPYERGRTHTVLIVGVNQQLTDTLILAIANEDTQAIDLISLPRDLYYRDIKINEYYYRYGARRLVREMESITGFDIDNFVIIDMYAFIDVVNILGGIDITLNDPLVDPTYRVRDNGHWSTLFYPAGTHHLNGIETLRVARSRHFIMDFGRSHHQQLILTAMFDKITSLGVSDIGRVYELVTVFLRYVETDYTPQDLLRYFLRFRFARVRSQTVFNARDILYPTYTNLLGTGLTEDEVDKDFNLGQYILLPLNDDWSLIHRFIRSAIGDPAISVSPAEIKDTEDTEDPAIDIDIDKPEGIEDSENIEDIDVIEESEDIIQPSEDGYMNEEE